MKDITPIILSGGVGLRLWPLSTKNLPKQFLNLPFNSKYSLFEQTILGLKNKFDKPIIVCSEEHKFLVLNSLKKYKILFTDIIVETISKNTAISTLLGVLHSKLTNKSKYSLILPSDHYIPNRDYSMLINKQFKKYYGHIIYGIKPSFASTDYGYVCTESNKKDVSKIKCFHEKPIKSKAQKFILNGCYWNSGIFLMNNDKLLDDFKKYHPKILDNCLKIVSSLTNDLSFIQTNSKIMKKLPEISIDNAILEKNDSLFMVKFKQNWKDLGSWNSVTDLSETNVKLDPKVNILNNAKNSNVVSDKRNTILNDVHDIIVVSTKESLLVSSKKNVNDLKILLKEKKNKSISDFQSTFYKPWGYYETFINTENYIVKKITVKPNHRLSKQFHKFRTEHWIVVNGIAKITKGNQKKILKKNESTFIPIGMVHCIENIGNEDLEIIEIQMGEILKESDIIRLDDPYKRKK